MRKIILAILVLLLCVSLAAAQPPFTPQETVQDALTIIYPKSTYIEGQDFKMHFHVYNSTGALVAPNTNNLNCSIHIYNETNSHLIQQVLDADGNGIDFDIDLNATTFFNAGVYSYVVWCESDMEDGFIGSEFEITGDGRQYEDEVTVLPIALMIITVFIIYFYVAVNWEFTLFEAKGKQNKQNAIKALFVWLGLLSIPVLVQLSVELATQVFGSGDVVNLLNLMFQVTIYVDIAVSVYFIVFFIYNILLYLAGTSEVEK